MSLHELWHVTVLASTLFAAAGLALVLLAPLAFDPPPPGLIGARPLVFALAGMAAILLVAEWTAIH
ncbi:MAG: hypothetical protein H0W21_06915 [Actinobacteria bacterium]|nr:hypothetical protein [Actinomycetota bacterium]